MGIYDRDYYRGGTHGSAHYSGSTSSTQKILIATIAVFLLQMITLGRIPYSGATEWLNLDTEKVLHGQVWRLLTYAFCHDPYSFQHILFNMLFFYILAKGLEAIYGDRQFLWFYLAASVFAGGCDLLLSLVLQEPHATVGASGAVMAVCMLSALYYPTQRIYVMLMIPVEIRWLVAFYVVMDSLPIISAFSPGGAATGDGIAHAAHLGGLAFGYLFKRFDLRLSDSFDLGRYWRNLRRRQQIRVYQPEMDEGTFKSRVDDVLEKISTHGEASLTSAERELLKEASRRYKKS